VVGRYHGGVEGTRDLVPPSPPLVDDEAGADGTVAGPPSAALTEPEAVIAATGASEAGRVAEARDVSQYSSAEPEDEFAAAASGPPSSPYDVCAHLVVPGAGWRAARPRREHRCGAVRPPLQLSADKQRRLCLVADHKECALFIEVRDRRSLELAGAGLSEEAVASRLARPLIHTAPLVLESGGTARRPGELGPRAMKGAQAAIAVLALVAIVAFVAARILGPGPARPTSGDGAQTAASGAPSASPPARTPLDTRTMPSPEATMPPVTPEPEPSIAGSVAPATSVPSPGAVRPTDATRTYRVKAGDTLIGIARRFGTTVKAIQAANAISDPRLIRIGQILKIP
jgi:hypothetical protein